MSGLTIRRAVARYAAHHGMSVEAAAFAPIVAMIGWLEAEEAREERERLEAAGGAAAHAEEDRDGDDRDR